MPTEPLCRMSAVDAVAALRRRDLKPADLITAAIARIEAVDGEINALPIRCFERALDQAKAMENAPDDEATLLAGLPIAFAWGSTALSFGLSLLVGVTFGLMPAIRAANVDPIEALRGE